MSAQRFAFRRRSSPPHDSPNELANKPAVLRACSVFRGHEQLLMHKPTYTLEDVLSSRVMFGYLKKQAELQHCSENIAFIQAVQIFEENHAEFSKAGTVREQALAIWNKFIDMESATDQICFNDVLYEQVKKQINDEHIDATLFAPMLDVPRITLKRDIFPRFLKSKSFEDMVFILKNPVQEYLDDFDLKSPPETYLPLEEMPDLNNVSFSLDEILEDTFLRENFFQWLHVRHMAESLLCYMEIRKFKKRYGARDLNPLETHHRCANIFFRFLKPKVKYEIACPISEKHKIGYVVSMEMPPKDIFDNIENIVKTQIKMEQWSQFRGSAAYVNMGSLYNEEIKKMKNSGSESCLIM